MFGLGTGELIIMLGAPAVMFVGFIGMIVAINKVSSARRKLVAPDAEQLTDNDEA